MTFFPSDYRTTKPNADVELYRGPITLTSEKQCLTHEGVLEWRWLPDPEVRFRVAKIPMTDLRLDPSGWLDGERQLSVPEAASAAPMAVSMAEFGFKRPFTLEGYLAGCLDIGKSEAMTAVQFQVVNLENFRFHGPGKTLCLQARDWEVRVQAVADIERLTEKLGRNGGYAIAHIAKLARRDGQPFSAAEVEPIRMALVKFFSFVQGRTVAPILPVGCDPAGQPVWRQWAPWIVCPWQSVLSWADRHRTDHFGEAFSGFMDLWQDGSWRDVLSTVIYWYVEANRNASGLEAGAIFVQMALELLAWHYLVEQKHAMTKDGFNRLTAADRIRLLLVEQQVPLDMPPTLPDLSHWAKEFNWTDAADAIATVRNIVVHPEAKLRERFETSEKSPVRDAWTCGLWLLEMVLLRLFRYTGPYSDRRSPAKYVGKVESVPWAKGYDDL